MRIGTALGAVLVPLSMATMAWADTAPGNDGANPVPYGYGPMWGHGWGHPWGGGWGPGAAFHPFFAIFALIGLVLVVTWVVRLITHGSIRAHHLGGPGGGRALEILEERFARGEIGKEEFEDKRRTIGR